MKISTIFSVNTSGVLSFKIFTFDIKVSSNFTNLVGWLPLVNINSHWVCSHKCFVSSVFAIYMSIVELLVCSFPTLTGEKTRRCWSSWNVRR